MARRAPAFVLNRAAVRHLNIAHGLYPREPLAERDLQAVLSYLRRHTSTAGGRVYAGGLVKFEPKELERIRLPRLEDIHGYLAEEKGTPETPKVGPVRLPGAGNRSVGNGSRCRPPNFAKETPP
jgi:hypothetical protein